uniref:Proteinral transcription factor iiic polypeptide 2 beta n=1 Tax=Amblyomma sculptum TaxID=1581419 RepID=A0A1E1XKE1_AMBSC
MGLRWTPQGQLCTASIDHTAQVWDLERPGIAPVSLYEKQPNRQLAVSPHWNGVFLVGEESVVSGSSHSVYRENGYYGFIPRSLTAHNATVWDVTVSPWSNVAASCDASGLVASIMLPSMSQNVELLKDYIKGRVPVYCALLVPLENKDEKESPPVGPMPGQCHSAAQERYGISFEDTPLHREGHALHQAADRVSSKSNSCSSGSNLYHLNSINTVCWSPNYTSATWLLSAGQAGVARLTWFGLCGGRLEKCRSVS